MGLHGVLSDDVFTQYDMEAEVPHVAMLMAARMCEDGDGSVISELASRSTQCPGLHFNFTASDSQFDPASAVQVLLDGIHSSNPTNFVIGPTRSASALPVALVAGSENVGVISATASSQDLSDRAEYSKFVRVIPSDKGTTKVAAQLASWYDLKHIGLVHADDSFGSSFRDDLEEACEEAGVTLHSEGFRVGDTTGAANAMATLGNEKLNVILLLAWDEDILAIADYALDNGMMGEGKLLIFLDAVTDANLDALAARSEALATALVRHQRLSVKTAFETTRTKNFRHSWADLQYDSSFMTYVNERLPGGQLFRVPSKGTYASRQVDVDFFETYTTDSLVQTVSLHFDAVVASCRALCMAYEKHGTISNMQNVIDMISSEDFVFSGLTGSMVLDASTGSRNISSVSYSLSSLALDATNNSTFTLEEVAVWSSDKWSTTNGDLIFPGDTTEVPLATETVIEDLNQIHPGVRGLMFSLMVVTEVSCIYFIIWTFMNKKSRVVVKSQPEFLVISLVGVMISTAAVIPLGMDDGILHSSLGLDVSCNAWILLWTFGNTILYGALITKLYRILRIFENPSLRTMKISNKDLYLRILAMLALTSSILTLWFSLDPMYYERRVDPIYSGVEVDSYGNLLESYGLCTDHRGLSTIFLAIVFCKNGLKFAGTTYMAYKCRHVDKQFQESAYIFMAVASMLQLYTLGVPIMFAIELKQTTVRFLVFGGLIVINNFVLAALVMVPKIRLVRQRAERVVQKSKQVTGHEATATSQAIKNDKFVVSDEGNDVNGFDFARALRHQAPSVSFADMYPTRESDDEGGDGDVSDAEDDNDAANGRDRRRRSAKQAAVRMA
ncbi:Metabotropic glutamate receptor-like protein E [Hondaea fermentalgiana]|uniref:Metabotropic glutamate receptor-like protein E n=1 Tax=Hondaea fermentalgiana TaxID=2315210 RepID=A0A2R5GAC2_9STRA|nr:Metabotropic glutamate receptor-like protein E [Hondaea fermentalgiana]|eukprot:GBG27239.1 Metabotropic glutamate receptor-like protein E [Hondaea fermentalgiana]